MNLDNPFNKNIFFEKGIKFASLPAFGTGNNILPAHVCEQVCKYFPVRFGKRKSTHDM